MHAKNYSLLHASGQVRLAPLYDIASTFPYYDVRQLKLAMKIGSHYEFAHVTDRDWDALDDIVGLSVAGSVRVRELAGRILEQLPFVTAELYGQGLTHEIIGRLEASIRQFATTKAA